MRKIFGALLILLAVFLSLSIFLIFVQLLLNADSTLPNDGSPHAIGYIIGTFIGIAFFALLNLAIYFIGFRLLRKKKDLVRISDKVLRLLNITAKDTVSLADKYLLCAIGK